MTQISALAMKPIAEEMSTEVKQQQTLVPLIENVQENSSLSSSQVLPDTENKSQLVLQNMEDEDVFEEDELIQAVVEEMKSRIQQGNMIPVDVKVFEDEESEMVLDPTAN